MTTLHYLAYGSNLHPLRLKERAPSARAVGVVAMPARVVKFHKRLLDAIEGLGHGYREARAGIALHGMSYRPFLYVAEESHIAPSLRPFHWYKAMVIAGARHHGFPEDYVAALEAVESAEDPDSQRADLHAALLDRMASY